MAVLGAIAIGALVSWRRAVDIARGRPTRRFAAHLSLMGAALFALMVLG